MSLKFGAKIIKFRHLCKFFSSFLAILPQERQKKEERLGGLENNM